MAWDESSPRLSSPRLLSSNTLQFALASHANRTHVIEVSTDLVNWWPLKTNIMVGTNMTLPVPRLPNQGHAFYRVARCPCISPGCSSSIARLSDPTALPDGRFQMTLNSVAGQSHVIEASNDLVNWVPVSTNTLNAAIMHVVVPRGTNLNHRFYRAIQCP